MLSKFFIKKNKKEKPFYKSHLFIVGVMTILFISLILITSYKNKIKKEIDTELSNHTRIFVAGVNPERIKSLTNTEGDLSNPDYLRVEEQLSKMEETSKTYNIRWVYTLFLKDNEIIFGPDSIIKGEFGDSKPGEIYEEVTTEMRDGILNSFNNGGDFSVGPYIDKWGEWISFLSPIKDFNNGEVLGILAVDIDYHIYKNILLNRVLLPSIIALLVLILFIIIFAYIYKIKKIKEESEKLNRLMFGRELKMIELKKEIIENQNLEVGNKTLEKIRNLGEKIIDKKGEKNAILNVLEDIALEKEKVELLVSELEKFKLAVENASDQVVITDAEGVVLYGNKAVEKITGYKPEEAIGRKAGTLWKQPMPIEYYEKMWQIIKDEKKVFISEIQNKRKNGEIYIADISISPILDKENNIIYYVAIEHDITKEKEIDRAKTEFVSLASHQLKTPTGAVKWDTEMLLGGDYGELQDKQKEVIKEISELNNRMIDLVTMFLNISRIELGTFIIEPISVNCSSVCEDVLIELEERIKEKKHQIIKNYQENMSEIQADPKILRIVFQNLLSNAIKYTKDDGRIKINIKTEDSEIKISVANNGEPIPEGEQKKIFGKMFRASSAPSYDPDGNGLGLYLLKNLVEGAGGKTWLTSKEGEDTIFYVTFPMPGMKKKEGTKKIS